jgi:hypothetical protein
VRAAAITLLLALAVAGCGGGGATPSAAASAVAPPTASDSPAPPDSAAPSDEASGPVVPDSPVAGIVVDVTAGSGSAIKGFTLRTNDGETIDFTLGTLENAADFPPDTLEDRQTTATPILVFFRQEGSGLVVYRIEDAG